MNPIVAFINLSFMFVGVLYCPASTDRLMNDVCWRGSIIGNPNPIVAEVLVKDSPLMILDSCHDYSSIYILSFLGSCCRKCS